jgi:hypothetical protein
MGRKGTGRYSHVGSSSCICTREVRESPVMSLHYSNSIIIYLHVSYVLDLTVLLQARDENNGADLLSKTPTVPANHSTMVGRYCSLSSILQPLLGHAVSSSQPLRTTIIPRMAEDTPHVCTYIPTAYNNIHVLPLHTSYMHCGLPRRRRAQRDTPPAPPCRSEDYIDRRISSALFAPTFLALSPCPCKNAGLPFRRLRNRLGESACLEAKFGESLWWLKITSYSTIFGVGTVISLMHDHPPAQPGSTQQPQQALAALVCC